jgi:peptidoglycan hydrolase-like protein with peptidoglycan-binding domain
MQLIQFDPKAPLVFNSTVATIQEWLTYLGFKYRKQNGSYAALESNGLYDEKTEKVVSDFQASESIYSDGIVGPVTMRSLEKAYTNRTLELNSPGKDFTEATVKCKLDPVYCDKYQEGYERGFLRSDAAEAYKKVRAEALAQGAILTSSGMMRSLDAQVTASRSAVSCHYIGLALDLYIYSGMTDPDKDPYVVVRDGDLTHRVWARCSDKWNFNKDKPAAIQLPADMEIKGVITYKNRDAAKAPVVKGKFVDLTAVFQKHGFQRISCRKGFYAGDTMMGAEWWHFQFEQGLMPRISTFGNELLKIYTEETLKNTPPWQQRTRIFKVNWY